MHEETNVVCTACATVYAFPVGAQAHGCPQCGGLSWVSARLLRANAGAQPSSLRKV
jgi:predicted RNA-binding Zn-ribbon protein involved in translation (DUF1610 family)